MQNNLNNFYDFTIIGAGASGLWMAYSLYKHGLLDQHTLVIVEQDKNKGNDRTWCYWAKEELEPIGLANKKWSYSVNSNLSSKRESIFPYVYYHISSQDFYLKMKAELSKCDNIRWIYSSFKSYQSNDLITVETHDSSWKTSKLFLSALPENEDIFTSNRLKSYLKNNSNKHILLWQSFVGWHIKTENPVFNPTKMTMMDFSIPQNQQAQFIYELSFTKNEALVEMTRFGKTKLSVADAESILKNYVGLKDTKYEIEELEIGAIPMTTYFDINRKVLNNNDRVIYLGTIAGAIKPTTGYGFKRMAKYADNFAYALANHLPLPTQHRNWRFRLYDILLLQILDEKPDKGKVIFETLFNTQPIPKILKFLDEETNILEEITIFSKLPISLFLKSLVKYISK
ncbi:lycopene cyclase family protein [Pelobium sp.]|nr:lycopene cyclase family protein [Pelobium sp.]MDA9555574.1 lycopene cyclase family protein [Pelobium sp.]